MSTPSRTIRPLGTASVIIGVMLTLFGFGLLYSTPAPLPYVGLLFVLTGVFVFFVGLGLTGDKRAMR